MSKVKVEEVQYGKFGKCARIYNETTEILVTLDIGPRIIKYANIGKPNVFCEHYTDEPTNENTGWKIYGGHRLWHAPENDPRTYVPDNDPVQYEVIENGINVTANTEKETGISKSMVIILAEVGCDAAVVHLVGNVGLWPAEFAAWSLSVMAAGGKEIIPMNQEDTGLLHNRSMSLWAYTKMNDERVYWGDKYITLKQDVNCGNQAFKIGLTNSLEWAAYVNNNQAFVMRYAHFDGEKYPDNNMSFETYTNDFMLEVETLSPLTTINPGEVIEHIELWSITQDVEIPENTEEAIQACVDKLNIPSSVYGGCGCGDDNCDCGDDHDCGDDGCECGCH